MGMRLEHINYIYSADTAFRKHALKDINLEIKDGEFIGWQIIHRYRASNNAGVVSFGNVLFVLDSTMTQCYYRFSLDEDEKNLKSIRETIENELGISSND